jgi:AmmeMemoRadiSam system protein A
MTGERLTADELQKLVTIARRAVDSAARGRPPSVPDPTDFVPALREPGAAFVTLRRAGALRGCIGSLAATLPLVVTVADRARAATLDDPRFTRVTPDELPDLEVSVSVLSPLEPMPVEGYAELLAEVRPGVDGLLVEAGRHRATLLPSVWDDLADPAAFVGALWRKAWLPERAWPSGIRVFRYTAQHAG